MGKQVVTDVCSPVINYPFHQLEKNAADEVIQSPEGSVQSALQTGRLPRAAQRALYTQAFTAGDLGTCETTSATPPLVFARRHHVLRAPVKLPPVIPPDEVRIEIRAFSFDFLFSITIRNALGACTCNSSPVFGLIVGDGTTNGGSFFHRFQPCTIDTSTANCDLQGSCSGLESGFTGSATIEFSRSVINLGPLNVVWAVNIDRTLACVFGEALEVDFTCRELFGGGVSAQSPPLLCSLPGHLAVTISAITSIQVRNIAGGLPSDWMDDIDEDGLYFDRTIIP